MSATSQPDTPQGSNQINLPAGVTIGPGRETSQSLNGSIVQGIQYTITLPGGTVSSVFVPYSLLPNAAQVQALFQNRVNQLLAITGS